MKKISLKKWFTWHVFPPKDVPIKSVYEFLFFLLLFVICVFLYIECNEVPFIEEDIRVECLDNRNIGDRNGNDYLKPTASIIYTMPCSKVEEVRNEIPYLSEKDKIIRNLIVNFSYNLFGKDSVGNYDIGFRLRDSYVRFNKIADSLIAAGHETFKDHEKYFYTQAFPENKNYRELYPNGKNKSIDHYYETFEWYAKNNNISLNKSVPVYYYEANQTIRKKALSKFYNMIGANSNSNQWIVDDSSKTSFWGTEIPYVNIYHIKTEDKLYQQGYVSGITAHGIEIKDPQEIALGDPGWFTMEDISQAYYKFNLKSETIDSIYLRIDFVGATNFSLITPEPDTITISSIAYDNPNKIKVIKEKGLFFHVKFSELENRQNVRMFFLTAIMSALFTIFIIFVVLALYKLATRKEAENI